LLILYALITIYSILGTALEIVSSRFTTPLVTLTGSAIAILHAKQREGCRRAL
jgi:hypothetical protein